MFRNIKLVLGYNVVTMGHELWLQWKETEKNMKKRAKYVFFHHFSGGGFLQTVNNRPRKSINLQINYAVFWPQRVNRIRTHTKNIK